MATNHEPPPNENNIERCVKTCNIEWDPFVFRFHFEELQKRKENVNYFCFASVLIMATSLIDNRIINWNVRRVAYDSPRTSPPLWSVYKYLITPWQALVAF